MKKNYIKSVSLSDELVEFLDDNPEISLSKLCQAKIMEIMGQRKLFEQEKVEFIKKINFLQKQIQKRQDFIDKNGLKEKFFEECGF